LELREGALKPHSWSRSEPFVSAVCHNDFDALSISSCEGTMMPLLNTKKLSNSTTILQEFGLLWLGLTQ
jgi:hypothetical protein